MQTTCQPWRDGFREIAVGFGTAFESERHGVSK